MRTETELDAIARQIIGCAIDVHRYIGTGCFESAYVPCLAHELRTKGLSIATAVWMDLIYQNLVVSHAYQIDLIVEGCVLVEVKALEQLAKIHMRQVSTYLKLTGFPLGLLLNFGAESMTAGVKRIVNNFPNGTEPIGRPSPSTIVA